FEATCDGPPSSRTSRLRSLNGLRESYLGRGLAFCKSPRRSGQLRPCAFRGPDVIEPIARTAIRRAPSPDTARPRHEAHRNSREPGPRGRGYGNVEDARRLRAPICPVGAAAGTQGYALRVPGPRRVHRKI